MPHLPTRDEAQKLSQEREAFYCKTIHVEDQLVEVYDYRLASLSDFESVPGARELRGLTYVLDRETYEWKRHILLNKFHNINETEGWMYDDVQNKKISRVQNKEDGSIVSFVDFKNGRIRAKSKTSFTSPHAEIAQDILDNNGRYYKFVKALLSMDVVPIFELVSPELQIVLEYQKTELRLIQLRNQLTGEYIPFDDFDIPREIHLCEDFGGFGFDLDELLYLKSTSQEDIEGWVVTFEDGQMAKIKTDKYLSLHHLIGPDAFRENLLVKTILDGNIDDVIAALVPGTKKDKIIALDEKVTNHYNHLVQEFIDLRGLYFNKFQEDRKKFAKKHSKDRLFGFVMKLLNTSFTEVHKAAGEKVKEYLLHNTRSLKMAKEYVESL